MLADFAKKRLAALLRGAGRWGGTIAGLFRDFGRLVRLRLQPLRKYYIPIDYKFAIAIALVIGGSMGVLGYTILHDQRELIHGQIHSMGSAAAGQLSEVAREPLLAEDDLQLGILVTGIQQEEGVLGAAVLDQTGAPLAAMGELPGAYRLLVRAYVDSGSTSQDQDGDPGRSASDLQDGVIDWHRAGSESGEPDATTFIRPIRYDVILLGFAMVTFDRASLNAALGRSRRAIYSATVVMILFGFVLSVVVGRRLSRPIHDLIQASTALGEGDLEYRFKGRRRDEIGKLMTSFNSMAEGLLQKSQVEDVFARYVPKPVAEKLLADLKEVKLGGSRVYATVVFADAAGFTSISEELEPDDVAELINDYFSHIARVAAFYMGAVDKYIGDEAMLVFGVPDPDPNHCFNAVAASVLFQKVVARISARREAEGKPSVQFKIGVNTGQMLAGNLGSADQMQFTVVGDSVNLASRLCGMAKPGEIVVSHEIHKRADVRNGIVLRRHESMRLRGKKRPVGTYLVTDVRPPHRRLMLAYLEELFGDGKKGETDV